MEAREPRPSTRTPAVLLYLLVFFANSLESFLLAGGAEPSPAFMLLYSLGFLWAVGWWLAADSRRHGVAWVYDMGMFLYIAWPLIMPYYLFKTRGAKAFLTILAFCGFYIGAHLVGLLFYAIL